MGERKHKTEGREKKVGQPQREEERRQKDLSANHLKLLSAGHATPTGIRALQRTVGNRVVTNVLQRHDIRKLKLDLDIEEMDLNMARIKYSKPQGEQGGPK